MGQTIIKLYRCEHCGRQLFEKNISAGEACKCGSRRVRHASPTFWRIVWFLMNHREYLKVWFNENVRNR
jgi:DNA-directed RNA polymerase subunit RPC12/RpoP